ncbi:hypothetical protein [Janthinobacterium agaricidamnosum]|uniref:Uncharacterized protein n=1 Tax=Janthinobacterium agaricidamnosum NBRC 102515 = DSM 9628 TaxID=1349767 RepID=W0V763_9BURK|nr:hypothetical protein [Janthinobacterium agaricidamnosum]CDG83102.1 putative uncharacterized protein [Janthinobacterium agaricidamnosum NBRC 102515 = DSM 9628]
MSTQLPPLLLEAIAAHGGLAQWNKFSQVSASVVVGGFLWSMKGIDMDDKPRTATADLQKQWLRVDGFGDPNWQMTFTPEKVLIETKAGEEIASQPDPRATFAGHTWESPWTPTQLAYFNGYATWLYFVTPFLLARPGFTFSDVPPISHNGETLRGLKVRFPAHIHTHSQEQVLYFGDDGLLRRHDYKVDVAGASPGAHFLSEYQEFQGIRFPTKRRVFVRNPDGSPQWDKNTVTADFSNYQLS